MTKKELRKLAKELRDSIEKEMVIQLSDIIQKRVCNHPWFEQSKNVFIYVSTGNEVRTNYIIEKAMKMGKRVCVPRVIPRVKMEAVPINNLNDDLQMGFFNIMEPKSNLQPINEKKIDLVIVPGLMFDRKGFRIGYGGGYYDKYIALLTPSCKTIGIAFEAQIADELPVDEHDMSVMTIITENDTIIPQGMDSGTR